MVQMMMMMLTVFFVYLLILFLFLFLFSRRAVKKEVPNIGLKDKSRVKAYSASQKTDEYNIMLIRSHALLTSQEIGEQLVSWPLALFF